MFRYLYTIPRLLINTTTQQTTRHSHCFIRYKHTAANAPLNNLSYITWYYATDKPKRELGFDYTSKQHKTLSTEKQLLDIFLQNEAYLKKPAKKFKSFNKDDSIRLEKMYQEYITSMKTGAVEKNLLMNSGTSEADGRYKVLVNEDKLFEVDVHNWELRPIYWEGAVYEVRRGVWFGPDKTPVGANMMIQVESHYKRLHQKQVRERKSKEMEDTGNSIQSFKQAQFKKKEEPFIPLYRMLEYSFDFGADLENETYKKVLHKIPKRKPSDFLYFSIEDPENQTVFIIPHDQKSLYTGGIVLNLLRNGIVTLGSTKLTRKKYATEQERQQMELDSDTNAKMAEENIKKEAYNVLGGLIPQSVVNLVGKNWINTLNGPFLGSGSPLDKKSSENSSSGTENQSSDHIADDLMKSSMENDFDSGNTYDNNREIDHLVLCVHGIGQTLGRKYQYVNFSHTINILRNNMKKLYKVDKGLQSLNNSDDPQNSRVQVLPITWRHKIEFNTNDVEKNSSFEELPTLMDLTLDGVKPIRKLLGDIGLDILLYDEDFYRKAILSEVISELNRIYNLYKENHPGFQGKISLVGHSLGSLIVFDILSNPELTKRLDFDVVNFFGIGSPVGVFKLVQRTMIGEDPTSRFFFSKKLKSHTPVKYAQLQCENYYNLYHLCDPIAYRVEPLVDKRLRNVEQEFVQTLSTTTQIAAKVWEISENLPSTSTPSPTTFQDQLRSKVMKVDGVHLEVENGKETKKILLNNDILHKLLKVNNKNGRIDYCLKSGLLEVDIINAIKSHVSYFEDMDVSTFLLTEVLKSAEHISKRHVQLTKN